ncbi:MAG: cupin domain-containing protein [Proteobacteria bacterium]|nr:cupin domain-containing protein [Pseudomonadota bacterium]
MNLRISVFLLVLPISSHAAEGFILKAGEGEILGNGIVIKASPAIGTQRSIMVEQSFPLEGSTGLHLHEQGDELFYVVSGQGSATLGESESPIGPGDVIFVPAGSIHRIRNLDYEEPLVVVFFMDSPELVDQFREMHEKAMENPDRRLTLDECTPSALVGQFKVIV